MTRYFVLLWLCLLCTARNVSASETKLSFKGGSLETSLPDDMKSPSRDELLQWVRDAAGAVTTYYGRFPVDHATLEIRKGTHPGVHHGVTYPRGGGFIIISVGEGTTVQQLHEDWTLTHEMIHLAFPAMAEEHHWIEEGISTYVEPVARAMTGNMSVDEVWKQFASDMPKGQPADNDAGLDNTHTWGRTYWGGAMFCLIADVRIREATHSQHGLQDALRAIVKHDGTIANDWPIENALKVGDEGTGTTVLADLYRTMKDKPSRMDLENLWKKLGVSVQNGNVTFDDRAPEADIRKTITEKR